MPEQYATEKDWKYAGFNSDVRLQWDPDHSPVGGKLERKAIQLGLRGDMLALYAREWIIWVEDISEFVSKQHQNLDNLDRLIVPSETIYPVMNLAVAKHLQISNISTD